MKILVGSKNELKINAVKEAFEEYFEDVNVEGIDVASEVPEEPVDLDIVKGTKNRINNLKEYVKENGINDIDYYVALESGITNRLGDFVIVTIARIEDNSEDFSSVGYSPAYPVPERFVDDIIKTDLGKVMDKVWNTENIGKKEGTISRLTDGKFNRKDISKIATIFALTRIINDKWK